MLKALTSALVSVAIVVAPAAATAAPVQTAPAPSVETVDADSELGRRGFFIWFVAALALAAAIYFAFIDDDEEPVSP